MQAKKTRHQFLLDPALSEKFERLCRHPGAKKSDLVAKAVTAFLDRRGESELDQRYAKRLDRLSRDIAHVRRDVETALESLALFIRFVITLNAHTPVPDKATQAVANERFLKFIDQVGRQIAGGRSSFGLKDENEEAQP